MTVAACLGCAGALWAGGGTPARLWRAPAGLLAPAGEDHTQPAVSLPAAGQETRSVRLSARPADAVTEAFLLERTSQARYPLTRVTSASPAGAAQFAATGLSEASYDLVLLTTRGRVEGVNLKPPQAVGTPQPSGPGEPSREGLLAAGTGSQREGEALPAQAEDRPFSERDAESIRKLVLGMTSFADRRRILFLKGSGTEARVLVEELTTRKTSLPSPVPFVVWRAEVWFYRKEFGAWDRYDSRVIARERLPVTQYEQTTWVFDPALGGLQVSEATPVVEVTYEVPEAFDPAHGLVAGGTPK